jgi:hypothetical protein
MPGNGRVFAGTRGRRAAAMTQNRYVAVFGISVVLSSKF